MLQCCSLCIYQSMPGVEKRNMAVKSQHLSLALTLLGSLRTCSCSPSCTRLVAATAWHLQQGCNTPCRKHFSKVLLCRNSKKKPILGRVWFAAKLLHWKQAWAIKSCGAFCRGMGQLLGAPAVINTRSEGKHWKTCSRSIETCVGFAIDF